MDPDPDRSTKGPTEPDDERLATLMRATAEDWRLPPQRLDQPTWRDRVGGRSARRPGWLVRLAGPAMAAVVATVVVAFVAVWLTAPRTDRAIVGKSPGATSIAPSASASSRPVASALPTLFQAGDLPQPARVMVRSDAAYQIADLATGTFSTLSIGSHSGPTTVLARPGGGWVCICADWTGTVDGRPSGVAVTILTVDASGATASTTPLRTLKGEADPALSVASQPELVDTRAITSPDGQYAFVGWSAKAGAGGWNAGIDVVDLGTASVVGSLGLDVAEPAGAAGRPSTRIAPRVAISPSGLQVLVSSFWYVEDPSPTPPSGTDHWSAAFDRGVVGSLAPVGATTGQACGEFDSGLIDATSYYALCWTPAGKLMLERTGLDGKPVDTTEVPPIDARLDGGSLVARLGNRLFLWDPLGAKLTRFDLRTGVMDSATATAAVPSTALDDLAALGRQIGGWMAPSAMAKALLQPAVVISTDGTTVYAIGIDSLNGGDTDGSSGVFAFNTTSLRMVGHWAATADFISLAVSRDGRFVYAAGQAGRDAAGHDANVAASITVYDTTDGSVRLIAGRLGSGLLLFPGPVVR
jgi:hypothetical protein